MVVRLINGFDRSAGVQGHLHSVPFNMWGGVGEQNLTLHFHLHLSFLKGFVFLFMNSCFGAAGFYFHLFIYFFHDAAPSLRAGSTINAPLRVNPARRSDRKTSEGYLPGRHTSCDAAAPPPFLLHLSHQETFVLF